MQSGGIAGVASLAKGASIKLINEQKDYSLWEFYYDPTKDTSMVGQSGINPMNGASPANATGTNNLGTSNSTNNSSFNNASPATPATTQTPNPTSQQSPVQQP